MLLCFCGENSEVQLKGNCCAIKRELRSDCVCAEVYTMPLFVFVSFTNTQRAKNMKKKFPKKYKKI